nr:YraN family protein [Paenibacillus alvei]
MKLPHTHRTSSLAPSMDIATSSIVENAKEERAVPKKLNRRARGAEAEQLAIAYLERLNYLIVDVNWRCKSGEIDIVAKDGDIWVFVEVRSRTEGLRYGGAAEAIDWRKQRKVRAVATAYMHRYRLDEVHVRFDAVAVTYSSSSQSGAIPKIELFQGAF